MIHKNLVALFQWKWTEFKEIKAAALAQLVRVFAPQMKGCMGVRIPAATDLSRLNRKSPLHCQTLGIRFECHGTSEMTITRVIHKYVDNVAVGRKTF